jgi:hypothetical protein
VPVLTYDIFKREKGFAKIVQNTIEIPARNLLGAGVDPKSVLFMVGENFLRATGYVMPFPEIANYVRGSMGGTPASFPSETFRTLATGAGRTRGFVPGDGLCGYTSVAIQYGCTAEQIQELILSDRAAIERHLPTIDGAEGRGTFRSILIQILQDNEVKPVGGKDVAGLTFDESKAAVLQLPSDKVRFALGRHLWMNQEDLQQLSHQLGRPMVLFVDPGWEHRAGQGVVGQHVDLFLPDAAAKEGIALTFESPDSRFLETRGYPPVDNPARARIDVELAQSGVTVDETTTVGNVASQLLADKRTIVLDLNASSRHFSPWLLPRDSTGSTPSGMGKPDIEKEKEKEKTDGTDIAEERETEEVDLEEEKEEEKEKELEK